MIPRRRILGWAAQPSEDESAIKAGQEAWLRTKADATWNDWLLVGRALAVGRARAMAKAETNKPTGSRYNREFGNWLDHHGFGDIDKGDRARLFAVVANLPAIEKWRATLTQTARARLNHPHSVWRKWQAKTKIPSSQKPTKSRDTIAKLKTENAALESRAQEAEAALDLDLHHDDLASLVRDLLIAKARQTPTEALAELGDIDPTHLAALAKWFAELAKASTEAEHAS